MKNKIIILFLLISASLFGVNNEIPRDASVEDIRVWSNFVDRVSGRSSRSTYQNFDDFLSSERSTLFYRETYCWYCDQDVEQSEEVFEIIDSLRPPLIQFDHNELVPFDDGGSCSAMALDFLSRYHDECVGLPDGNAKRKCVRSFKPYYRSDNTTYISRQAAYNTIFVSSSARSSEKEKIRHQKMQSLANYHNLVLVPVTDSIKVDSLYNGRVNLARKVDNFSDGTYVIRMLDPTNNRKQEWYGHTVILIKGKDFSVYFDNSEGATEITGRVGKFVQQELEDWEIPVFRIYRAKCGSEGCMNISQERN